jgi:hypothetical protein
MSGGEVPQTPLDPIASDSISHSTTHDEANAGPILDIALLQLALIKMPLIKMPLIKMHSMDYQRGSTHADPSPGCLPEVLGAPHSQRSRQHRVDRPALRRTGGRGPYDAGPK